MRHADVEWISTVRFMYIVTTQRKKNLRLCDWKYSVISLPTSLCLSLVIHAISNIHAIHVETQTRQINVL